MSFKDTQSYKELQSDWRWIHSMDPEAAAAADQWVKEHPEEWKELEHMLYYSEANFRKRAAPDTLEDLDIKQPRSYNPEAFLPEEVRNAIYNDRRWFDRSKYLPEGSDEDPFMYLDTQIYDALHALTELQREILFRTIINGESTESVAQDKQCSSRNIRDIRARALRQIRAKIKRREGYGRPDVASIILLFMLLVGVPLALLTVTAAHTPSLSVLIICWGAAMTAVCLAFQTVLLTVAPDAADVAASLYSGIFNVGIGGGAFIGSRVSEAAGFMPVAYVGAAIVGVSLLSLLVVKLKTGKWLLGEQTGHKVGEPVHESH